MTREEAAAKAVYEAVTGRTWEKATPRSAKLCREDAAAIVKAADAHDQANGIHRVRLDDDALFGAIYAATDKRDWAVSDVVEAVKSALDGEGKG